MLARGSAAVHATSRSTLLKTFADQAVIAIENVRLFKELQARNAEVTESLEQQTAIAEILRVISSTPTDVTPVLEAVTHRAAQLCDAPDARLSPGGGRHACGTSRVSAISRGTCRRSR